MLFKTVIEPNPVLNIVENAQLSRLIELRANRGAARTAAGEEGGGRYTTRPLDVYGA